MRKFLLILILCGLAVSIGLPGETSATLIFTEDFEELVPVQTGLQDFVGGTVYPADFSGFSLGTWFYDPFDRYGDRDGVGLYNPEGDTVAFSNGGRLNYFVTPILADRTYTLTVDVGLLNANPNIGPSQYNILLVANDFNNDAHILAQTGRQWAQKGETFDFETIMLSWTVDDYVGYNLGIKLVGYGTPGATEVSWNNINLTNDTDGNGGSTNPVPEPATMLLLGSGLIGLSMMRRKFRK